MPLAMFGVKEQSNLRWLVVVRVHSDCAEVATCSWGCEPRHVFAGPGTESRAHPAPSVLLDRSAAENSLEDLALVIDGTPQIHLLARDPDDHFVEMPGDRSVEDGTVAGPERSPVRI
jgi:hypothetical protein